MAKTTKVTITVTQREAGTISCALAECERQGLILKKDLPMIQKLHGSVKRALEAALNA